MHSSLDSRPHEGSGHGQCKGAANGWCRRWIRGRRERKARSSGNTFDAQAHPRTQVVCLHVYYSIYTWQDTSETSSAETDAGATGLVIGPASNNSWSSPCIYCEEYQKESGINTGKDASIDSGINE